MTQASASPSTPPVVLTIAGSDPSGGAGIQADLKTFHQHGVYGAAVLTLLTVQNTQGVSAVSVVSPELVGDQIDAVLGDLPVAAVKTGALGSAAVVEVVAARLRASSLPVVVDPVMISKHGAALLDADARRAVRDHLLPVATLLTPNAAEAAALGGAAVEDTAGAERAARSLLARGPRAVLVKGGHLTADADTSRSVDVLAMRRGEAAPATEDAALVRIAGPRVATPHTHGTGCTLSAAIAARLAWGDGPETAVRGAKAWLTLALRRGWSVGQGIGPVDHLTPLPPLRGAGGEPAG